jgi:hypothetical protein
MLPASDGKLIRNDEGLLRKLYASNEDGCTVHGRLSIKIPALACTVKPEGPLNRVALVCLAPGVPFTTDSSSEVVFQHDGVYMRK